MEGLLFVSLPFRGGSERSAAPVFIILLWLSWLAVRGMCRQGHGSCMHVAPHHLLDLLKTMSRPSVLSAL